MLIMLVTSLVALPGYMTTLAITSFMPELHAQGKRRELERILRSAATAATVASLVLLGTLALGAAAPVLGQADASKGKPPTAVIRDLSLDVHDVDPVALPAVALGLEDQLLAVRRPAGLAGAHIERRRRVVGERA